MLANYAEPDVNFTINLPNHVNIRIVKNNFSYEVDLGPSRLYIGPIGYIIAEELHIQYSVPREVRNNSVLWKSVEPVFQCSSKV